MSLISNLILPWQILGPILGALLGLIAGSFLATLVLRWPQGLTLSGRSRCDSCGKPLGVTELVPILSWLAARGRCRNCGADIDPLHPMIEFSCAIVGVLAQLAAPGLEGLAGALFGWFLIALAALDTRHLWLPDALTLPLLALGLLLGPGDWQTRLLSAALAGGSLWLVARVFQAIRKREGMGMGDVKLMAAIGAWLSPAHLPPLLLLSALLGLAAVGVARLRGRKIDSDVRIPFGACLAAAAFPLWLFFAGGG